MEVLLKDVGIEGMDPYSEDVYEYSVVLQLESGKKITIGEYSGEDLNPYIGKKIKCLIGLGGVEVIDISLNPNVNLLYWSIIKGKYIKQYKIPLEWKDYSNEIRSVIQTPDGVFILGFLNLEKFKIKDGDEIIVDIKRYDLLEWYIIN